MHVEKTGAGYKSLENEGVRYSAPLSSFVGEALLSMEG